MLHKVVYSLNAKNKSGPATSKPMLQLYLSKKIKHNFLSPVMALNVRNKHQTKENITLQYTILLQHFNNYVEQTLKNFNTHIDQFLQTIFFLFVFLPTGEQPIAIKTKLTQNRLEYFITPLSCLRKIACNRLFGFIFLFACWTWTGSDGWHI